MIDIDRRRFLRQAGVASAVAGAAWVAPTVSGSTNAFAATSPGTCPSSDDIAFVPGISGSTGGTGNVGNGYGVSSNPADNNGWVFTAAGMTGGDGLGVFSDFYTQVGTLPPQFAVQRNPATNNIGAAKVTYTHGLGPLSTATTYTFSSQIFSVNSNQYTQLLRVLILDTNSNVVETLGQYRTDTTNASGSWTLLTNNTWVPYTWTFHPADAATYQISFEFTFTTGGSFGGSNRVGDDIAVTSPAVSCA